VAHSEGPKFKASTAKKKKKKIEGEAHQIIKGGKM
jgi:hypothetical protein